MVLTSIITFHRKPITLGKLEVHHEIPSKSVVPKLVSRTKGYTILDLLTAWTH